MPSNILVFFTDDHAQWALPCYGNSEIIAPSLDYLARTGIRMDNAFTPIPVCSPARASFWTGLYPSQHGVHDHLAEPDDVVSAHPWLEGLPTLAEHLHAVGYTTALCGKWHCGLGEVPKPGFDYWFSAWRQTPKYFNLTSRYSDHGDVREITGYDTQIITDAALRFLRQRDTEQPFFLFVGFATTHNPWINRPERLVEHYRRQATFRDIPDEAPYPFGTAGFHPARPDDPREAAAQYYASVTQIDEMVGRVLDELDALGERDQTLVIYTADHGLNLGHHQVWGKGNGTLPINMLDESIRVPLILNHPGVLPAGQVRQAFVNHTDLFMTLLDYADALPQDTAAYPGRSYQDVLVHAGVVDWHNTYIGEYGNVRALRNEQYKLVKYYPDGPHLLFDMQQDPRETINLYDEPAYQDVVATLSAEIDTFFAQYENPSHSGLNAPDLPKHNAGEAWRHP
jgi:choline-sulfatase